MPLDITEFESFEQQFLELVGEFQSISASEERLRDALRAECKTAEAAVAARESSERAAAEAKSNAAATTAAATQAATMLAKAQEEIITLKMQLELAERQRMLFEERCIETTSKIVSMEKELQQLKSLQSTHPALQRQYVELQECVRSAAEDARNEATRLENELRRVERCASGGQELRERARLAAAAHVRDRRLQAAELHHLSKELLKANSEISRLGIVIVELQHRLTELGNVDSKTKNLVDHDVESLSEVRAALEAERAGAARLERALAAALADNVTLAAQLQAADKSDNDPVQPSPPPATPNTDVCPIDSFLAQ